MGFSEEERDDYIRGYRDICHLCSEELAVTSDGVCLPCDEKHPQAAMEVFVTFDPCCDDCGSVPCQCRMVRESDARREVKRYKARAERAEALLRAYVTQGHRLCFHQRRRAEELLGLPYVRFGEPHQPPGLPDDVRAAMAETERLASGSPVRTIRKSRTVQPGNSSGLCENCETAYDAGYQDGVEGNSRNWPPEGTP